MELRKFIATTIREYLNEMAMPSSTHIDTFWYHGTSKDNISKIIQDKLYQKLVSSYLLTF
jgi:hypothetical protein